MNTNHEGTPHIPQEYEREPVPPKAQKTAKSFWGMYAGEHAAGTEFMIGPLFLLAGVSLNDIFFGLLLGNLLAVLSWRYLCAPIATQARMTLYYQLEKIAGPGLVKIYNLANGVLFCFLAGAMITVSATAVGVPLNLPMPSFDAIYPESATFVIAVLVVGAVIALVASFGYDAVSKVANIAVPWMVLVFLACGVVALKQLNVSSYAELQAVWTESIRFAGGDSPDAPRMGFWSVVLFAWFCNSAMHIGMSDLSIFRYAKKSSYGWATAGGMYVGHYMAWIAAAFMLAAQIKVSQDATPLPGPMAYNVAGVAGIICVIIAGWTTANPTIYRAGLAFQGIFPKRSRVTMTLLAGGIATIAAIFPALAFKLLGFVGLYGTILAPIGGVIFADWFLAKRFGVTRFPAESGKVRYNPAVLFAWLIPVSIALWLITFHGITPWYFPLPAWIVCAFLYLLFSRMSRSSKSPL